MAVLLCSLGVQGCASDTVEKKNTINDVAKASAEKSEKSETEGKKGKQMENKWKTNYLSWLLPAVP